MVNAEAQKYAQDRAQYYFKVAGNAIYQSDKDIFTRMGQFLLDVAPDAPSVDMVVSIDDTMDAQPGHIDYYESLLKSQKAAGLTFFDPIPTPVNAAPVPEPQPTVITKEPVAVGEDAWNATYVPLEQALSVGMGQVYDAARAYEGQVSNLTMYGLQDKAPDWQSFFQSVGKNGLTYTLAAVEQSSGLGQKRTPQNGVVESPIETPAYLGQPGTVQYPFLTMPEVLNPEQATAKGIDIPAGWFVKLTPDKSEKGYSVVYIGPDKSEVPEDQLVQDEAGVWLTPTEVQARQAAADEITNLFAGAFPEGVQGAPDIKSLLQWVHDSPEGFGHAIATEGQNPKTEALLRYIFPGITQEQITQVFHPAPAVGADQQELTARALEVWPDKSLKDVLAYATNSPDAFLKDIGAFGRTPATETILSQLYPDMTVEQKDWIFKTDEEKQAWLNDTGKLGAQRNDTVKAAFPGITDEEINTIYGNLSLASGQSPLESGFGASQLASGTYTWGDCTMPGVLNPKTGKIEATQPGAPYQSDMLAPFKDVLKILNKYVDRPWEVAVMQGQQALNMITGQADPLDTAVATKLQANRDKYGFWGALVSEDVPDIWNDFAKTQPGGKFSTTILDMLNPVYLIPVGGAFGLAADFTSKIPVIGESLAKIAGGVQAVEKGMMLPVTDAIEGAAKYTGKALEAVGQEIGDVAVNQLIKDSGHLLPLMELPTNEKLLTELLAPNWMRTVMQTAAKVGPIKTGIETTLGKRILIEQGVKDVENAVGEAAVVKGAIDRMGVDTATLKTNELASMISDDRKFFGFTGDNAYSDMMAKRILPEYKATVEVAGPEAAAQFGTLEHIFKSPGMYDWTGIEQGLTYIERVKEVNQKVTALLVKEGVKPEVVTQDYLKRIVEGYTDPETGKFIPVKGTPGIKSHSLGGKASYEMHLQFPTMADGIAAGYRFGQSMRTSVSAYIQEAFMKIGDERALTEISSQLEKLGLAPRTVSEIVAEQYPGLVAKWEGISKQVTNLNYTLDAVKRVARGEQLPASTLAAVRRSAPDVAAKLEEALAISPTNLSKVLKSFSKEFWDGIKITRKQFNDALEMVRSERAAGEPLTSPAILEMTGDKRVVLPAGEAPVSSGSEALGWGAPKVEGTTYAPESGAGISAGTKGGVTVSDLSRTLERLNADNKTTQTMLEKIYLAPLSRQVAQQTEIKQMLSDLSAELKTAIEEKKPTYHEIKGELQAKTELARQPTLTEGYLMQAFAGGKKYDREFIDAFNKFFGYKPGVGVLQATADVAGVLRITKASLDFSAMTIQGIPSWGLAHATLLTDPANGIKMVGEWYKAYAYSIATFFDPELISKYIAKNIDSEMSRVGATGSSRAIDYFSAMEAKGGLGGLAEKAMSKIPFHPFERANQTFYAGGEVVRDAFWKILSPNAIVQGKEIELAKFLDNLTGLADASAGMVPLTARQLESTFAWFAPNYTRACLTVLSDIFRGGLTGAEARKALGGMIGAGTTFYATTVYSMAMLEGATNEQAMDRILAGFGVQHDPITGGWSWKTTGAFMSLPIGNYNFGLGGFWYGLISLASNIDQSLTETGNSKRTDFLSLGRNNPFVQWWYNRSSPLVGGVSSLMGKNPYFLGKPFESPAQFGRYVLGLLEPIWMEQGINPLIPKMAKQYEVPEGTLAKIGTPVLQLMGLRVNPDSLWTKFYDAAKPLIARITDDMLAQNYSGDALQKAIDARNKGTLGWADLTKLLQSQLMTMSPDLTAKYNTALDDSKKRDTPLWKSYLADTTAAKTTYYQRGDELWKQLQAGSIDTKALRQSWSDAGTMYGTSINTIENSAVYKPIYDQLNALQSDGSKDSQYADLALQDYNSVMFSDYLDAQGEWDWNAKDAAVQDYIDRWGQDTYQLIKKMYSDKKLREGLNPTFVRLADDKDLLNEYWKLPHTTDVEQQARIDYRINNPQVDALLTLWGYNKNIQTRAAYDLVIKEADELGIPLSRITELPPENIADVSFAYQKIISVPHYLRAEAELLRLENPDFNQWGLKTGLFTGKLDDKDIDALRISVKWKKEDAAYDALTLKSEGEAYLKSHPEYADDRVRRDAYQLRLEKSQIENYVAYKKLPTSGYEQEWFLQKHPVFNTAMAKAGIWEFEKELTDVPTPQVASQYAEYKAVANKYGGNSPQAQLYRLQHSDFNQWASETGKFTGVIDKTVEELQFSIKWQPFDEEYQQLTSVGDRADYLTANPDYAQARFEIEAYKAGITEDLIAQYAEYKQIPTTGYEQEWYLAEHQDLYEFMVKKGIIQAKDFSNLPSREVYGLYQQYQNLPLGEARKEFRRQHPDLQEWGVKTGVWSELKVTPTPVPSDLQKMDGEYHALDTAAKKKQYRYDHPDYEKWGETTYGWTTLKVTPTPVPSDLQKMDGEYHALDTAAKKKQYRRDHPDYETWGEQTYGWQPLK